jgi:putative transposase
MGTGRPKQALNLSAQERVDLEAIVSSRGLPHGLVRRANMILLTESGVSIREAARRVKVTPPTVTNWRRRFREGRLAGLHDQLKSGRPRTHSEEDIAVLLNAAADPSPCSGHALECA